MKIFEKLVELTNKCRLGFFDESYQETEVRPVLDRIRPQLAAKLAEIDDGGFEDLSIAVITGFPTDNYVTVALQSQDFADYEGVTRVLARIYPTFDKVPAFEVFAFLGRKPVWYASTEHETADSIHSLVAEAMTEEFAEE